MSLRSRAMTVMRIFGAICAVLAVFLFGMWLAWPDLPYNPSGFPIGRRFVAVSLNGQPLIVRGAPKVATIEVRGRLTFKHRAGGTSLCSTWGRPVTFLPGKRIAWRPEPVFQIAVAPCDSAMSELDQKFLRALLSALRWRTEKGELILENGRDILRFQLAPPGLPD